MHRKLINVPRKGVLINIVPIPRRMNSMLKTGAKAEGKSKTRKKGWWSRFLKRLGKANSESSRALCRH